MPLSDQEINEILEENKDLKKQLTELSSRQRSSKRNSLYEVKKAHVGSKDWITDLKKWQVIGAETIAKNYSLDGSYKNEFDADYYTLIRK